MGPPVQEAKPHRNNLASPDPPVEFTDRTGQNAGSIIENFSIVVGGPVYDLLLRAGLLRFGLPNIMRRVVALVAITWLPLLVLALKEGVAFGHRVMVPLLYDYATYGRFLVGLPLLMLAEAVIDPAIQRSVHEFVSAGIVPESEVPGFEQVLRRTQRLRDAAIPEIVLLALAFFPVFVFQHEWAAGSIASWHTDAEGLTTAGWWYAAFSAPLMRFILYRWAYRYFIWTILLVRISRLRLILMPTHPDHAAGLDFLSFTQRRFGILFCATGCSIAGRIANAMVFEGATLKSYQFPMVGFVVLSLMVGVLPLTVWAPRLSKVRRMGLLEYGRLAKRYTESFDQKWVHPEAPPTEALLGTGDIQSLADLGNSYGMVQSMAIVPITKRLIMQLAVQAALPLVPVIILGTPTTQLINVVLKMVV
jgi:hypothetical protein